MPPNTIAVAPSPAQRIERVALNCLLSSKQAMAYLEISRSTLFRRIKSGIIRAMKIGDRWKFKSEDLALVKESMPSLTGLLSAKEVCEYLAISRSTLYRFINCGKVLAHKLKVKGLYRWYFEIEGLKSALLPLSA